MIYTLSRYAFMAALRDKVILSFLVLVGVGISLSFFMGSATTLESKQFSVVYAANGLRLSGILSLTLFVIFYIRNAFENKDIEFLLSRPISRPVFILGHSFAFMALAALCALIVILSVFFMIPQEITTGHYVWACSLLFEYLIVVNVAMFFSMVLPSATMGALAVLAFYVLSRLMGQILGILDFGITIPFIHIMDTAMQVISLTIPRLDLYAQTSWLIYGVEGNVGFTFFVFQGVAYSALLICASMIDLVRRQF